MFIIEEKYKKVWVHSVKKKIIVPMIIVGALLFIICFKQLFHFVYNEYVISQYEKGNYDVNEDILLFMNCFQPYIAHYNNGNIHYQNRDYEEAITSYEEALTLNPPQEKECAIRINLALAIIKTLKEDYDQPENIEESIEILNLARDVLLEEECATEDGDGHSETAETLKKEIEEEIKRLEQIAEEEEKKSDPNSQGGSNDSKDEEEENLKQELQEIQSGAYQERQEGMQSVEEWESMFDFNYGGVIW